MKFFFFPTWCCLKYLWILTRRCSEEDSALSWLLQNFRFTQETASISSANICCYFAYGSQTDPQPSCVSKPGIEWSSLQEIISYVLRKLRTHPPMAALDRSESSCVRSVAGDDYLEDSYLAWTQSGSLLLRSLSRGELFF